MRCECCDYTSDISVQSSYSQLFTRGSKGLVRPREPDNAYICDTCYGEVVNAIKEFEDEYTRSLEEFYPSKST